MSLFTKALYGVGAVLLGKTIGKGVEYAYETFIPAGGQSFLSDIGINKEAAGKAGEAGVDAVSAALTSSFDDLPNVGMASVATSGGNTAGTFAAGKSATVPLGTTNRVPNMIGRQNVRNALISRVQTVGVPRPNVTTPTIKLGSSRVQRVRKKKAK